ncbi:RloB family protein [Nonomuraea sp. NPDC050790]|uniref:RloB family protein n=1 Tax=Nonomuraea sp. NPDC050790 TaxID=3364371 RepID=UPI0037B5B2F2
MTRRSGRSQKPQSKIARRRSLRVYTEGKRTEVLYLQHWHRLFRDQVLVTIDEFHGTPLPLVREAAKRKREDERDQRRGRGDAFDEYWCMFDVDEHPGLTAAMVMAGANGINIAVSNPCLELWFMLHFQDQYAAIDRKVAQTIAATQLNCGKVLSPHALQHLEEQYELAVERAQKLDSKHEGDGSPEGSNPSSSVWRLVNRIRSQ